MIELNGIETNKLLQLVLSAVLGVLGGAIGYWFHGWRDKKVLPRIETDTETLKQFSLDRKAFLEKISTLLFNLDHWLRTRIPDDKDEDGRKNTICMSRENIASVRELSRAATGLSQDEKVHLVAFIKAETDAAKACLDLYELNKQPIFDEFDKLQKERMYFTSKLEEFLRFF